MKETRKLKKRNLHNVTGKINAEETDGKRVENKIQRKKKVKVSNVGLSEDPHATQLQAKSSEKPNRQKVELKKKIQKSKEIKSTPADGKLSGKMKVKVSNVDLSEDPQATQLQDISIEKTKVKKVQLKKKIQKCKEIKSSPADGKLSGKIKKRKEKGGNVDISEPNLEALSTEKVKGKKGKMNKTKKKRKAAEISSVSVEDDYLKREGKSKKSNKKKKMEMTSTKENKIEEEEDVYQISSGDEDCTRGMKKWVTDYYESRPGLDELQKRIDDFMTSHEERLEQEKQDREAKAAEGGWTVVVHHKGRKKTTETESGTAVGSFSQAALEDKLAKKKQSEPVAHGFYRFQRREAQRNEIMALQSKFEQDKKRIQQLRAARRFKPF